MTTSNASISAGRSAGRAASIFGANAVTACLAYIKLTWRGSIPTDLHEPQLLANEDPEDCGRFFPTGVSDGHNSRHLFALGFRRHLPRQYAVAR
jgi:hypothetical protein